MSEPKTHAAAYAEAGYTLEHAKACLDDFRKTGRADKVAYYEKLIADLEALEKPKAKPRKAARKKE